MPFISLDYEQAHEFVETQQKLGNEVEWEGWDLAFFRPNPAAKTQRNGVFKADRWGFEKRICPDQNGIWSVPDQYKLDRPIGSRRR